MSFICGRTGVVLVIRSRYGNLLKVENRPDYIISGRKGLIVGRESRVGDVIQTLKVKVSLHVKEGDGNDGEGVRGVAIEENGVFGIRHFNMAKAIFPVCDSKGNIVAI